MDTVFIHGLRVEAIVGIYEWERNIKQAIEITIEMAYDIVPAAQQDDIHLTLNYKSVSERITELVVEGRFLLLETMAEAIAQTIMREFDVCWLRLDVSKPDALTSARQVGVRIERGSSEKP